MIDITLKYNCPFCSSPLEMQRVEGMTDHMHQIDESEWLSYFKKNSVKIEYHCKNCECVVIHTSGVTTERFLGMWNYLVGIGFAHLGSYEKEI